MRLRNAAPLIVGLVGIASAETYEFFRWNTPGANLAAGDIYRRQSQSFPPGYNPEFGSCGTGRTCEDACGPNWESCQASTDLSLFCYNRVDLNQTCCPNGSGRACDSGYYCAWEEIGGKVWCCEDGQSLEECGVPNATTIPSSPTSTSAPTSSSSTSGSGTATRTITTGGETLSTNTASQCPASTVTSWATTTVSVAEVTVTVTMPGPGCAPSSSGSGSFPPSGSSSLPGTVTEPPFPTSTYTPPIFDNSTTTSSFIVTAGSGRLGANSLGLVALLLPLLWI